MPERRDTTLLREPLEEEYKRAANTVAKLVHAIRDCPQTFPCPFCTVGDGCIVMADRILDAAKLQEARDAARP